VHKIYRENSKNTATGHTKYGRTRYEIKLIVTGFNDVGVTRLRLCDLMPIVAVATPQ